MLSCDFACVAEKIIESRGSNALTIVEILERMEVSLFPVVVPALVAIFFVVKEEADPDPTPLRLKASLGDVDIIDRVFDIGFGGKLRTRCNFQFQGFPIPQAGHLAFKLLHDDRVIGKWTILIEQNVQLSPPAHVDVPAPA